MATQAQLIRKSRFSMKNKSGSPALLQCPQRKGIVIKSFIVTPRKPNSAKRKCAKVRLTNRRRIFVFFEGIGLNRLQPHSQVLVRGGRVRDLPGVKYQTIRGIFDVLPFNAQIRRKGRSKYGVKWPKDLVRKKNLESYLSVKSKGKLERNKARKLRQKMKRLICLKTQSHFLYNQR